MMPVGIDLENLQSPTWLALTWLALALPFLCAPLAPLVARLSSLAGIVLAIIPATTGIIFASLWHPGISEEPVTASWNWIPALNLSLSFSLDGLALFMSILICTIAAAIFIYAGAYLKGEPLLGRFWATMLVFLGSMIAAVTSDNFLSFFIFWELTSVCSYLLIGYHHTSEKSRSAALQALLVTGLGGIALLVGFLILSAHLGVHSFSELHALPTVYALPNAIALPENSLVTAALVLMLVGAFTKSAQFPFHFWLPGAMAAPTPISAFLHSATMVKLGVFLLARLSPTTAAIPWWNNVLMLVGSVTLLLGTWNACHRSDLKQILAHSTVATLGALTLLLGTNSQYAATAALLLLLAHALYKGALFMVCGAIDHATNTRELPTLRNLGSRLPITATAAAIACLSMAGFVPTLGFLAKEYGYKALAEMMATGAYLPAAALSAAFLANSLGVTIALAIGFGIFFWQRPASKEAASLTPVSSGTIQHADAHEASFGIWLPPLLLGLCTAALGCAPQTVEYFLAPALHDLRAGNVPQIKLWTGVNSALLLSIATLGLGLVTWYFASVRRFFLPNQTKALSAVVYNQVLSGLLRFASRITGILQNGSTTRYVRVILAVVVGAVGASLINSHLPWSGIISQLLLGSDWHHVAPDLVVGAFMMLAAVAALYTDSRIAALAELGIVGLGMSLLFVLYGAPDLALTTLLVETLSLIVFVVVLLALPSHATTAHETSARSTRVFDGALAIGAGVVFSALIISAQGGSPGTLLRDFFGAHSYAQANGKNVVNVILVDFRAFDTMGEITVLCLAALGVAALIRAGRRRLSDSTEGR
jgi:multicomponent Na+:H+ antiporter subunit A